MDVPVVVGHYSTIQEYIREELCMPRLREANNFVFPPKYMYITQLIPLVLDLTNVHYTRWSSLFRETARAYNLLHHIDPTVPTPPLPDIINIASIHDDDITVWGQHDTVILTWIYATISPYLLARLIEGIYVTTAMQAWARLRDICREYETTMHRKKRKFIHIDLNQDCENGDEEDGNDGRVDLVSNLPDDLLIYVLSLAADVKTAGRSSILSKRWMHVWTHLMDLDFNDQETSRTLKCTWLAQPEIDKFVDGVNRVISANQAPYLNTFRIHFPLNSHYTADIDNWLKFAFDKEVRNLELNFMDCHSRIHLFKIFPTNIVNTTLQSLYLKSVIIKGTLLQWVIKNCLNLQRLSVCSCMASADDDASSKLQLKISSLNLKHLEFFYCLKKLNFDALHLSAPNLTSFIFYEHKIDVEYCSVPSLVDATFGGSYLQHLETLSRFCSQLEKLSIQWYKVLYNFSGCPINSGFTTFINVQQLEIVYSQRGFYLISVASLIEACPLMHTFKLKLIYWNQLEGSRKFLSQFNAKIKAICPHQHLKAVEYLGYAGCPFAAELALCLTQRAPMLRRFIFRTGQPQYNKNKDQMEIVRRKTEVLAKKIRQTQGLANVVIL